MAPPLSDINELGTVLSVWAHPDDEAYLAGGVMAAVTGSGRRAVCITATAGEAGESTFAGDTREGLGARRRHELRDALAKVGVHEFEIIGMPDGACEQLGERAPIGVIARHIEQYAPDTILTFGPDGVTGHPDHIAVSHWVDLAVQRARVEPPRVLHAATTADHMDEFADVHEQLGLYVDQQPDIVHRDDLAFELVLGPRLLAAKLAALRAHRSQTSPVFDLIGAQRMADWVRVEAFVEAPPR